MKILIAGFIGVLVSAAPMTIWQTVLAEAKTESAVFTRATRGAI